MTAFCSRAHRVERQPVRRRPSQRLRRCTRLGGGAGAGSGGDAAVEAVPDAVGERVAVVEGGGRAGRGGLVHPDPLGRPPGAARPAEVEVADAVAAGAGHPERVRGAALEAVPRRQPRRVHLVAVRVPEREAHRVRGAPRGRAARLDLHRVRARAPRQRQICGGGIVGLGRLACRSRLQRERVRRGGERERCRKERERTASASSGTVLEAMGC